MRRIVLCGVKCFDGVGINPAREFVISFADNFTCTDAVSGVTYGRGIMTQGEYEALFAGNTYSEDAGDLTLNSYTIDADGTSSHYYNGAEPSDT